MCTVAHSVVRYEDLDVVRQKYSSLVLSGCICSDKKVSLVYRNEMLLIYLILDNILK